MSNEFNTPATRVETPDEFYLMESGFELFFKLLSFKTKIKLIKAKLYPFQAFYKTIFCESNTLTDHLDKDVLSEIQTLKNNLLLFSRLELPEQWMDHDEYSEKENLLFKFLLHYSPLEVQTLLGTYGVNNLCRVRELLSHDKFRSNVDTITIQSLNEILVMFLSAESANNMIEFSYESIIFKRNTKLTVRDYMVDVLRERNEPMHYSDIYNACRGLGINRINKGTVKASLHHYPELFGSKSAGYIGLKEWGGYFGTIGDVAEQYLLEKGSPVSLQELKELLLKELKVKPLSITGLLFRYKHENRFVRLENNMVGLKQCNDNKKD